MKNFVAKVKDAMRHRHCDTCLSTVVRADVLRGRITPPLMCIGNVFWDICIFSRLPVETSPTAAP